MSHVCPDCKSSIFKIIKAEDTFTRNDKDFTLVVEHSECIACGYEVIFSEQIKRNDELFKEAWKLIDEEKV
jgi:predicted Zn-ribbon and HTH transcriptional regulator